MLLPFFDALLAHAPCGIVYAAPDDRIAYVNPKAVTLLSDQQPADPLGKTWREEPILEALLRGADLTRARESGKPAVCHASPRTGYQGRMTYDAVVLALSTGTGEDAGLLIYLTGQLAETEPARSFVQAEKYSALNIVVAGVAHEINNPLTSILGTAQILLSKIDDPQQARRLHLICEESERCGRIVANLLGYSQSFRLVKEPTDLNKLIDETVALCRYQMEVDNISVKVNLDPVLPEVPLQSQEMQRVIVAILNNAHLALTEIEDRPRNLTVSTQSHGEMVRIIFADTGPGVPTDLQDRIFDPFFSTRSLGAGTGLGLSVAYGLAQDHGGRLWIESTEGKGAKFVMELPVAPGDA